MWSLRRGLAAAAAGGLRKIPPKLVANPSPAFTCWPPFSESNYARNLTPSNPCQNNWKLFEDPELPELVKLYNHCCRNCGNASMDSDSNKVDREGKWNNLNDSKIPMKWDNITEMNIPKPYSLDKIKSLGSKQALKKTKFDNTTDKRVSLQQNANGTHSSTTNKRSSRLSKQLSKHKAIGSTKSSKVKKSFETSNETFKSYESSLSKKSLRDQKHPEEPWEIGNPERPGHWANHYFESRENFKGFRSPYSKNSLKSSRSNFSKKSSHYDARRDSEEPSPPPEKEEEVLPLRRFRKSLFGSVHSSKSNISVRPSTGNSIPEGNATNAVFCYHFEPIDLVKHKMNFLASHSRKPYATKSVWPKIWPKPLERRPRNVKSEDLSPKEPVPIKKRRKGRRLCKATSCQSQSCPSKCLKYHTFTMKNFHICDEICGTRNKKAVASQTESLPDGSGLCNLCRSHSQPVEPVPYEMKQRQDREELRRYYLRMRQREKSSEKSEGSFLKGRCTSSSRKQMRRQLEQCQAALTLCGQLVEARIRLCRIRSLNEGCSGVPEPKQC